MVKPVLRHGSMPGACPSCGGDPTWESLVDADGERWLAVCRCGRMQAYLPSRTMIAESPSPSCTARATPTRRRQMAQARRRVRLCAKARVSGVAFFDFFHGQTGVAPNAIELHPVLGFRCVPT
jgi:hypothetical protein